MYSCEQPDHTATRTTFNSNYQQPCATARSLHLSAHQPGQALPAAVGPVATVQPRRAKKKPAARPPSSRHSSTTVVPTDVANFRAMVQELTGFPQAAIFRPLPRRVHAANPFVVASGQGCGGEGHGRGSEAANSTAGGNSSPDAPAVQPVIAQSAPPGVFDGLSDLGSPEFDSWADLSIE
ncbi:uncharacterized protein LOC133917720 [Phragmites australis]|uniref:uncharacterized protein LOC133917720 n=1 Tax=Phragmites australis TaxID=29695 RepID=UPI002D780064|nr:uncharacterized protein LOC133917720 [Phragmites australis]